MRRGTRRLLLAGVGTAAGLAAAAGGTAYLVHRARAAPDPARDEPLWERPGAERRVVSFDGTELAVNVVGPGRRTARGRNRPTLVFVHGFTLDMTAWYFQWKAFSRDFRCVLYDQRGQGRSAPAAGGDYSLEALGHDVRAVLDATVGGDPVVLVGHSLGGMAMMAFAAAYPDEFGSRVRGVVFANTTAGDVLKAILGNLGARVGTLLVPGARRLARRPDRLFRLRASALGRGAGVAFLAARITNFGAQAPPSVVDHVVRTAVNMPAEVWADLAGSLLELDLAHALDNVRVPALVIVGDVDRLTPPSSAIALKRALPDARMVVFRGSGHCTMLERHRQFNDLLAGFVEDVAGEASAAAPSHGTRAAAAAGSPAAGTG